MPYKDGLLIGGDKISFPHAELREKQVADKEKRRRAAKRLARTKQGTGVLDTQVGRMMRPIVGFREQQRLQGIRPKDFVAKNRRALQRAQEKNRLRRVREQKRAAQPKYKHLRRFQNARGRSIQPRAVRREPAALRPEGSAVPTLPPIDAKRVAARKSAERQHNEARGGDADEGCLTSSIMQARMRASNMAPPQKRQGRGRDASWMASVDARGRPVGTPNGPDTGEGPVGSAPPGGPRGPPLSAQLASFAAGQQPEERPKPNHGPAAKEARRRRAEDRVRDERRRRRRKERRRAEQRARKAEASRRSAPSATERARQLSEDERAATMQVLQESRRKTAEALRRMPLQLNGDGQIKRSEALNAKLDEIERAIELFNREVVIVRKRA
jgi:hypothetical protein